MLGNSREKNRPLNLSERSGRSLLVKMYDAIPSPEIFVPFIDIAEFKEKHRDDLILFRRHMNELYIKISNSSDKNMSFKLEVQNLVESIKKICDSMDSMDIKFNFIGISAKTKWNIDISSAAKVGAITALLSDLEKALAAAISYASINMILPKIDIEAVHGIADARRKDPLIYAALIAKDQI